MIWLGFGMLATFAIGYEAAKAYALYAPALSAAKGFGQFFHFNNPTGPSSAPTADGKAIQSQ